MSNATISNLYTIKVYDHEAEQWSDLQSGLSKEAATAELGRLVPEWWGKRTHVGVSELGDVLEVTPPDKVLPRHKRHGEHDIYLR